MESIGLTGYEIKAVSTLLTGGQQTAAEASQKSGIPYSKIYEVLGQLETAGWIGSDESRPTRYFARSPVTSLETVKQKAEDEFAQNQNIIVNELVPMYEKSGVSEKPDIWVLSGTINIVTKILEIVDSCKNEVMIAAPEASQELVKQSLPKLRYLHDKGVSITILTSDKLPAESLKSAARIASVRTRKGLFAGGIISDKRYVVILFGSEMGRSKSSDSVAIWADHTGLAGFAREYFEYLVLDSEGVES